MYSPRPSVQSGSLLLLWLFRLYLAVGGVVLVSFLDRRFMLIGVRLIFQLETVSS